MKRTLLAAATLGTMLAVAVPVVAHQYRDGPGGPGRMGHGGHGMMMGNHFERMCENREARLAGILAFAESKLGITDQQRAAWDKFAQTVKGSSAAMNEVCAQPVNPDQPPALPQRVERMEKMTAARLEQLRTIRPALQELYQTLTPDQQKTAEDLVKHRGRM